MLAVDKRHVAFWRNYGGVLPSPSAVLPALYGTLRVTSILPLDTKRAADSDVRRRIRYVVNGKVRLPTLRTPRWILNVSTIVFNTTFAMSII